MEKRSFKFPKLLPKVRGKSQGAMAKAFIEVIGSVFQSILVSFYTIQYIV